ncbi:hypothetical protein O3M35_011286 [Rhynocoris fuscipes]|uniref:Uncharacterized protein n=1 Tax=Rhynocoris fuscipes TaxID=488301 RepID=A0AAW1CW03_9HEMI
MKLFEYLVVIFVLKGAIQELKIYGRAHLADLNCKPFKNLTGGVIVSPGWGTEVRLRTGINVESDMYVIGA